LGNQAAHCRADVAWNNRGIVRETIAEWLALYAGVTEVEGYSWDSWESLGFEEIRPRGSSRGLYQT
jgi:hypothetical protein